MPFFEPPIVYDNPPFLPTTKGRVLTYARHRALQPRGRTVLKISPPGDTVRYPLLTLFPDVDVFPQEVSDPPIYITVDGPTVDQVNAATIAYLGGHIYYVDDTEAAALTAAGFTVTPDAADTAPPVLKILEPSPYANVSDTLTITVSAPDATSISGTIGSTPFNFAPSTFTHSLSVAGFTGGTYRVSITARDAAFNSSSAFVDVVISEPPPPVIPTILPSPTLLPSTELLP